MWKYLQHNPFIGYIRDWRKEDSNKRSVGLSFGKEKETFTANESQKMEEELQALLSPASIQLSSQKKSVCGWFLAGLLLPFSKSTCNTGETRLTTSGRERGGQESRKKNILLLYFKVRSSWTAACHSLWWWCTSSCPRWRICNREISSFMRTYKTVERWVFKFGMPSEMWKVSWIMVNERKGLLNWKIKKTEQELLDT